MVLGDILVSVGGQALQSFDEGDHGVFGVFRFAEYISNTRDGSSKRLSTMLTERWVENERRSVMAVEM
jgi:hypothetical protein